MERLTRPEVVSPQDLANELAKVDQHVLVVGDGARRYSEVLAGAGGVELAGAAFDHPQPADLLELAATRPSVPLEEIMPLYLRGADVRIGWQERTPEVVARHG
jgi:tRNA A37 threonylcarbamoyladenosine modification protein TsaB